MLRLRDWHIDQQKVVEFDEEAWLAKRLEIQRTHLPDLHQQFASPEWDAIDCTEQHRIAALATLRALAAKTVDIDALQERVVQYAQGTPEGARETVH